MRELLIAVGILAAWGLLIAVINGCKMAKAQKKITEIQRLIEEKEEKE